MTNEEIRNIQIWLGCNKFDECYKSIINNIIIINKGKENIDKDTFGLLIIHCLNNGFVNEFIYFVLKLFSNSTTFNMADYRYSTYIKPLLQHLNEQQLIELICVIDNNPQIYNRVSSYSDNTEIIRKCKHSLAYNFDLEKYNNFVFDKAVINEDKKNLDIKERFGESGTCWERNQ